MTVHEAIFWLQEILNDTLDPNDKSDSKRIEAVEFAMQTLQKKI